MKHDYLDQLFGLSGQTAVVVGGTGVLGGALADGLAAAAVRGGAARPRRSLSARAQSPLANWSAPRSIRHELRRGAALRAQRVEHNELRPFLGLRLNSAEGRRRRALLRQARRRRHWLARAHESYCQDRQREICGSLEAQSRKDA